MKISYPIFILATDDHSISIVEKQNQLNQFEYQDINSGLYKGWDSNGYPVKLICKSILSEIIVEFSSESPELNKLKNSVIQYVKSYTKYYRPEEPFIFNKNLKDRPVELINLAKQHIKNASIFRRLINFFKRF